MTRLLRALLVTGVAILSLVAPAGPAAAHARLETTDPADGSIVAEPPSEVRLTFSEAVSIADDGIRVVNGEGDRVDEGNARRGDRDGVVVVDLDDDLDRGTYVVSWRIRSIDSHPIQGAFQFSVGEETEVDAALLADAEADPETGWQTAAAIFRGLIAAGGLLAVGGTAFLLLLSDRELPAWAPSVRIVTLAALVAAVASVLILPVQAVLATGGGFGAMTDGEALRQAVGDGIGLSTVLTIAGLALTVAALRRAGDAVPLALGGAALVLVAFTVSGHTRSATSPALMMVSDLVHVTAGAVWFGGLVMLAVHLRARRRSDEPVAATRMVARFSAIAAWSLLMVALAGVALAWMEVRTLDALGSTTYGRLLIVKVAFVALVALGGAYNRFGLVPAMLKQPDQRSQWRLMGTVARLEAGGLVAALALTAVLVNVTPARDAVGATDEPISTTVAFGDGTMQLVVDPGAAGPNDVHFYFLDESGQVLPNFQELIVEFTLPEKEIGPISHAATAAGPGHYSIPAHFFEPAGRWTITAVARIDTFTQTRAVAEATVR